jgi:hypothetical protein
MSDQLHTNAALTRGNNLRYTLDRRLGGPRRPSGSCGQEKILILTRNWTLAVLSIARRYTDWALRPPLKTSHCAKHLCIIQNTDQNIACMHLYLKHLWMRWITNKYVLSRVMLWLIYKEGVWIGWLDLLHLTRSHSRNYRQYRAIAVLHTFNSP